MKRRAVGPGCGSRQGGCAAGMRPDLAMFRDAFRGQAGSCDPRERPVQRAQEIQRDWAHGQLIAVR